LSDATAGGTDFLIELRNSSASTSSFNAGAFATDLDHRGPVKLLDEACR